jgi:hypothetical protein
MRRGLATYLRLSSPEETGSGAGRRPRFLLSGDNPLHGEGAIAEVAHDAFALDRPPGPQRRTGSATYRAADGPPFPLPSSAKQAGRVHSAALAELRHPDGDVALAFELVGHYDRDALFCPLRAEQILAVVWRVQPAVGGHARRHEWA